MESTALFLQLAIVLGLSVALGFLIKSLKVPILVAYLLAGVILTLGQTLNLQTSQALAFLPEIGIAFVLFLIGMELDLAEIKSLGKPILVAGVGQIIISLILGYVIAQTLGYGQTESIFLGVGLSVSSTIVVVKLLLEKKDLSSLYGKLSLGILLLEDLVSVLILMALTVGSSFFNFGLQISYPMLAFVLKAISLFALTFILANFVLPKIFRSIATSPELLFLTSITWCFVFVSLALFLGFSVVIGAFLAGVALANSPFHLEIQGKMKPLRDFFVALFFVYLGSQIRVTEIVVALPLVVAFTLYALILKPIIFLLILGSFGFKKHTIFQASLSLSQISEFSLIIAVVGLKLGVISPVGVTGIALTAVNSMILSSIMISQSKRLYKIFAPLVDLFEHKKFTHTLESKVTFEQLINHVILIGAHRMGGKIAEFLKEEKIPCLVLDFNPKIIDGLAEQKINALYGDIGDPEILDLLDFNKAKLIISTASDLEDNLTLLSEVKKRSSTVLIVRAQSAQDAKLLYKAGADYVILPEVLAGDFLLEKLKMHWPNLDFFKNRFEVELHKLNQNHLALS